jgi:hypothetical protein
MFGGMLVAYLESLFDIPFSLSLIFQIELILYGCCKSEEGEDNLS